MEWDWPLTYPVVFLLCSDYIIKEKTVLLQKKDNEGFGFVLRGAKGERGTLDQGPTILFSI